MAKLFLDGIFKNGNESPSAVYITMPNSPSGRNYILTGLMVGDPTWTVGNKWGPIINDLSNLQDWASIVGSESQFSWINASTMCWKGTNPIGIGIEFFLINYAPGLKLEENLASLTALAAIEKGNYDGMAGNFIVKVHGGYAADVLSGNNKAYFTRKPDINGMTKGKQQDASRDLGGIESALYKGGYAQGAISLRFGNKAKINNLLVSKISITESTVEVADANGNNNKPLYYRVSAQFTGVRPLITTDVNSMFNVNLSEYGPITAVAPNSKGIVESAAEIISKNPGVTAGVIEGVTTAMAAPSAPMGFVSGFAGGYGKNALLSRAIRYGTNVGTKIKNKFIQN